MGKSDIYTIPVDLPKTKKTHNTYFPFSPKVKLEGALGHIAKNSTRNPKQIISLPVSIHLSPTNTTDGGDTATSHGDVEGALSPDGKRLSKVATPATILSPIKVLNSIEGLYTGVLNLEHLQRKVAGIARDKAFEKKDEDGNFVVGEEEKQERR